MNIFGLPAATGTATEIDWLIAALLIISIAVLGLVFGLLLLYIVRYRHNSKLDRGKIAKKTWRFEIAWTSVTLVFFLGLFIWGAIVYSRLFTPPSDALKIYVVGKQWMWKVEYPGGQREIDSLHVPVNRDVELLMTSEDVIHDFSVPAFRIKHDVLPGRYEMLWFKADRVGNYRLFCTQLCGADHSSMTGQVVVMNATDYARWLAESQTGQSLAAQGQALFMRYGCSGCHQAGRSGGGGAVRAPSLNGVFGSPVPLSDGTVVIADEKYIRDSILLPKSQIVASYDPVMPSFSGVIDESDIIKLIAYIKSLAGNR
jgi:cytochrome c oxidase subunit 2